MNLQVQKEPRQQQRSPWSCINSVNTRISQTAIQVPAKSWLGISKELNLLVVSSETCLIISSIGSILHIKTLFAWNAVFLHPSQQFCAFSREHRPYDHLNAPSVRWFIMVAEFKLLADSKLLVTVETIHTLWFMRFKIFNRDQLRALKSLSTLCLHVRNVLVKL